MVVVREGPVYLPRLGVYGTSWSVRTPRKKGWSQWDPGASGTDSSHSPSLYDLWWDGDLRRWGLGVEKDQEREGEGKGKEGCDEERS